jgi:hypothetical protein
MGMQVVVVRPFGLHSKGDMVTDASEIAKILASEAASNVVRVGVPVLSPGGAAAAANPNGATKGS